MKLSKKLESILDNIQSPIAQDLLDVDTQIQYLDIAGDSSTFSYKQGKHDTISKVGKLVKFIFKNKYSDKDIWQFTELYKSEYDLQNQSELIEELDEDSNWIFDTFKRLTTETYPYGTEEQVVPLLKVNLETDSCGNYYKVIGKSTTMFTSHLDTASATKKTVGFRIGKDKMGDTWAYTDGSSILGADDKTGVTIMLWMMKHNIPGLYYFFIGEERGGIGSNDLSSIFESQEHLSDITKCVSFDRRDFGSVITHQMGKQCCSIEFANSLASELNKHGMNYSQDPTGIFTDSAFFVNKIRECTNLSVGYFNEHTGTERQNITFLSKLCKSVLKVNWEGLIINRELKFGPEFTKKWGTLIDSIESQNFTNEVVIDMDDEFLVVCMFIDSKDLDLTQRDISIITEIISSHVKTESYKIDIFEDNLKIKIIK